jgi:hypothetical protein
MRIINRLSILILIGFAGLLASCGSSVSSSTQPGTNDIYTVVVSPVQFTLNNGDWTSISATVDLSNDNGASAPIRPQPTIKFYTGDPRVTVSPAGEVCAGQWDSRYLVCSPDTALPTGYVTVTAYDVSHNVSGTTLVSLHQRAASISLSAPVFTQPVTVSVVNVKGTTIPTTNIPVGQYPSTTGCISQSNFAVVGGQLVSNNQVQFAAAAVDANGNPIPRCSVSPVAGCINDNDYTWTTENTAVAQASLYGFVAARTPGVTNVYATLNGTISQPLGFVTCPPSSIVLSTSPYTGTTPSAPFTTADLTLNKGDQKYVNATLTDRNGLPLITSPLTYITSDPLTGSFTTGTALSSILTANTSGRFTMMAACEPASCNPAVANFTSPAGPETGEAAGFGYPIYSNVVGATVEGITGSSVLVTGTLFPDGVTASHKLLAYDSESLALTQTVELANLPNSLVIAPNGAMAYLGSSAGLMVLNLSTYQATLQAYPIAGGLSTDVITGTVLGVSPDSRYVLISDVANNYVFLIDTIGTKIATRYTIPNITSVTFAADGSNIWIGGGGTAGVYVFQADTFVPTTHDISANVNALAWMPDGQSYFASGNPSIINDTLVNYSTCNDQNPQTPTLNFPSSVPQGLSTTALEGVPHLLGLDSSTWFDYSVTSSSQVPIQTITAPGTLSNITPGGTGNVCLTIAPPATITITIAPPATITPALPCTAQQITFSPTLEQEFVTGVNASCGTAQPVIYGYDVATNSEFTLTTTSPVVPLSGGVLNDGRKLYFGTWAGTVAQTATLHRIDLSTGTGAPGTRTEDDSVSVGVVPSFVAVVPK